MRFPLELRLKIYESILREDVQPVLVVSNAAKTVAARPIEERQEGVTKSKARKKNEGRKRAKARAKEAARSGGVNDGISASHGTLNIGLLQVSRQIRDEACLMYYKLNNFRFLRPMELFTWLFHLQAEQKNQLHTIECHLGATVYSTRGVKQLAKCEGLQKLKITADFIEMMMLIVPDMLQPYLGISTPSYPMECMQTNNVGIDDVSSRHPSDPRDLCLSLVSTRQGASPDVRNKLFAASEKLSRSADFQDCWYYDGREAVEMGIRTWDRVLMAGASSRVSELE